MKKTSTAILLLIIIISAINTPPMISAQDGSVSAASVRVDFTVKNQYSQNYTEMGGSGYTENYYSGEDQITADLWYNWGGPSANLTIDAARLNYYSSVYDKWELAASLYEYAGSGDAGALLVYSGIQEFNIGTSESNIENFYFNNFSLPAGYDKFYFATQGDSHANFLRLRYRVRNGGEQYGELWTDGRTFPTKLSPFSGENAALDKNLKNRLDIKYTLRNQTTINEYYGNATAYTARRDFNYSFPTAAIDGGAGTLQDRRIVFYYPATEALINISYPTGGVFNQSIPTGEINTGTYNNTHRYAEITNAAITSYGSDLRIYTESKDYQYYLSRPYYENGTIYNSSITVTASKQGDSSDLIINSNTLYGLDQAVNVFTWDITGGLTRKIYPLNNDNLLITYPDGAANAYSFEFRDYGARIGDSNTYLEAVRVINGSETVIERNIIYNSESPTVLNLVTGKNYIIRVLFDDGQYYTFGYYTPDGSTAPPTINIYGVDFDQQFQPRASWINIEHARPNSTHIKVVYNDTLADYDTLNLTVYYMLRNGTHIGQNSSAGVENHAFNWYNADNITHYLVTLQVTHEYYGVFNVTQLLAGEYDYQTPPSWAFIGIGLELISVFIILAVGATVSKLYNYLGILAAAIVATALTVAGWVFIPTWLITLAAIIGVGLAMRETR